MNIDWGLAGSVILSGLVIVFLILIILILAVMLVSKLVGTASKKKDDSSPAKAPAPKMEPAPKVQAGIGDETVAAISAAICGYMDEAVPGVSYAVKSIRRTDGERPVWGFAGMRQNTRPF